MILILEQKVHSTNFQQSGQESTLIEHTRFGVVNLNKPRYQQLLHEASAYYN